MYGCQLGNYSEVALRGFMLHSLCFAPNHHRDYRFQIGATTLQALSKRYGQSHRDLLNHHLDTNFDQEVGF
jgi:hypothetical protein